MAEPSKDIPSGGRINPGARRGQAPAPDIPQLARAIRSGDRVALGKAITLLESTRTHDAQAARQLIERCMPHSGHSLRLGITGSPGVGKSTFIEAFGLFLIREAEKKVAVLAIDPSSGSSRGSILGDKTRMEDLGRHPEAFIRPSPAGGSLGGVARTTRESIILCEAAGFDLIIVETVGVGQSETTVHSMVDFFLLLLQPGAGDELQGIKRGIVEMADLIAINKAEAAREAVARQSARHYRQALHFFPPKYPHWQVPVTLCSALEGKGVSEIWEHIQAFEAAGRKNGLIVDNRRKQAGFWLDEAIRSRLTRIFEQDPAVRNLRREIRESVLRGEMSPFEGAQRLLDLFQHSGPLPE